MDFKQKQKQINDRKDDYYEDEEWLMYADRKAEETLNTGKGAFVNDNAEISINTAKSVFDRTAVFRRDTR